MPDAIFEEPRLARLYDELEGSRDDLGHYEALIEELDARSVLDVGCGTGELACRLARRGIEVVGVDPAAASLDVARTKPGSDAVRWVHGDATSLPDLSVDLAVMTGNVAQVFLTDDAWEETLDGIHGALRDGGWFVFETRDPARRAWEEWTRYASFETVQTRDGVVDSWVDVTLVSLPFVTFSSVVHFVDSGEQLASTSTLRFRGRAELEESLDEAGFSVHEVRDAPDRPGREWVFVCRRV